MSETNGISREKIAIHEEDKAWWTWNYVLHLQEQVAWLRGEVERKGILTEMLVARLCETIDLEEPDEMAKARRTL